MLQPSLSHSNDGCSRSSNIQQLLKQYWNRGFNCRGSFSICSGMWAIPPKSAVSTKLFNLPMPRWALTTRLLNSSKWDLSRCCRWRVSLCSCISLFFIVSIAPEWDCCKSTNRSARFMMPFSSKSNGLAEFSDSWWDPTRPGCWVGLCTRPTLWKSLGLPCGITDCSRISSFFCMMLKLFPMIFTASGRSKTGCSSVALIYSTVFRTKYSAFCRVIRSFSKAFFRDLALVDNISTMTR